MTPIALAKIRMDLYDCIALGGQQFEPKHLISVLENIPDDLIIGCQDERDYGSIILGYIASQLIVTQAFEKEIRH